MTYAKSAAGVRATSGASMYDFFVSYTGVDKAWAEWVGWILEENGQRVVLQAWDFRPGSNFVIEMQRAASKAARTVAILSPEYLESRFAASEWAAAFAQDPEGLNRSLVPVRVRDCKPVALLKPIVHVDLVGLDETAARHALLVGLLEKRSKPATRPSFPGDATKPAKTLRDAKPFPGKATNDSVSQRTKSVPYIPKMQGTLSDLDRTRFLKQAFGTIQGHFGDGVSELKRQPNIEVEFDRTSGLDFSVEVFMNGNHCGRCRIWLNHGFGTQICYYEGDRIRGGNAFNEALGLADNQDTLALSAMMKMNLPFTPGIEGLNLGRLTAEDAAEYLWRRFASSLERGQRK